MREVLFWAVVSSLSLSNALLVWSILRPELRFWPPPDSSSRRYRYTRFNSVLGPLTVIAVFALGVLDWNRGPLDHLSWPRFVLGGVFFSAGGALALWGYLGLGVRASQGLHHGLVASGAYRFSRNPQYVGTIVCLLGYALTCNSALTFLAWVLWSAWFIMAPFAEEPWLREKLGPSFDDYVARVPRFLRWRGAQSRSAA